MSFFKDFAQSFASGYGGLKIAEAEREHDLNKIREQAKVTAEAGMNADIAVASHRAKLEMDKEKALREQLKGQVGSRLGVLGPTESEISSGVYRDAPTAEPSVIDMGEPSFDEIIETPLTSQNVFSDAPIADTEIGKTIPTPNEIPVAVENDPVYLNYKAAALDMYASGQFEEAAEILNKGLLKVSESRAAVSTAEAKDRNKSGIKQEVNDQFLKNAKATGYEAIYSPNFTNVDDYFWGLNKSRAQKSIEAFKPDAKKKKTYVETIERGLKMIPDITFTTGEGGLEALAIRDSKTADFLGIVDVLTVENFGGKLGVGVSDADVKLIRNAVINSRSKQGAKNALVFGLAKAKRSAQYANAIETYVDVNGTTNGFNRLYDAYESASTQLTSTEDGDYALREGKYDNFDDWLAAEASNLTTDGVMDMRKIRSYIQENTPEDIVTEAPTGSVVATPRYTEGMTLDDLSPENRQRLEEAGLL